MFVPLSNFFLTMGKADQLVFFSAILSYFHTQKPNNYTNCYTSSFLEGFKNWLSIVVETNELF